MIEEDGRYQVKGEKDMESKWAGSETNFINLNFATE